MERTETLVAGDDTGAEGTGRSEPSNLSARFIVQDEKGLHMRPLTEVTEICLDAEFAGLEMELFSPNSSAAKSADPRSIMSLMLLAADYGAQIEFRCRGCEKLWAKMLERLKALSFIRYEEAIA